jgi:AcrR family transcriptional regulator
MPKIIENIRENLLAEARRQVMEQGYAAMTIRSVAKACGVGVGTVYNYFPSKDMLVASFMLEDWQQCLQRIKAGCYSRDTDESSAGLSVYEAADHALRCIYDELKTFMEQHVTLFQDESAGVSFNTSLPQRHGQLRSQIAEPLLSVCAEQDKAEPGFLAEFVAESMLTWTLSGRKYEEISSILLQVF